MKHRGVIRHVNLFVERDLQCILYLARIIFCPIPYNLHAWEYGPFNYQNNLREVIWKTAPGFLWRAVVNEKVLHQDYCSLPTANFCWYEYITVLISFKGSSNSGLLSLRFWNCWGTSTNLESAEEIKKSQRNRLRIRSSAFIDIYTETDQATINNEQLTRFT